VVDWRAVPGYEGRYEVSDGGQVRSLLKQPPTILQPTSFAPYGKVTLWRSGRWNVNIHVLVMAAFFPPRPPGMEARHLNGDPLDNRAANLAWGTHAENMQDKNRHGHHHYGSRTHCKHGHEYTPENTSIRVRGKYRARVCITCSRASAR
jgi:hypothetical protein